MSKCAAAIKELRAELLVTEQRKDALERALELLENLDAGRPLDAGAGRKERAVKTPAARSTPAPGASVYTCHACGQPGHTARNKACPKRGGVAAKGEPVKAELAGPHDRLAAIKARAATVVAKRADA